MHPVNALFSKPVSVFASLALSGLLLSAGWSTLPTRGGPPNLSYRQMEPAGAPDGTGPVPVFLMQEDHATLRSGTARLGDDGAVDITLFDPSDPRLIHGSEAVLFSTDLRVLWLLATEDERRELWRSVQEVGRGLREAVDAVLSAPEFTNDYRNQLKDIARQSIEEAWRAPSTRAAYEELLRGMEPLLRDVVVRDVKGIVVKQVEPLIWNLISANMGSLVDVFRSQPWDLTPVDRALDTVEREVRDRGILQRAVQQVLDSWQARAFLQAFAGNVMDAMARDTRLREIAGRMVNDARLGAYMKPLSRPVGNLARLAPNILFGVQPNADLNALAAYTFQAFLTGRAGRFIVLMSARQREEILRLDPFSPRPLLHSVPQ